MHTDVNKRKHPCRLNGEERIEKLKIKRKVIASIAGNPIVKLHQDV